MEFLHYQQYLDKLFCKGNLWKHRTFRTVLDCGSTEWNQTSIEKKIEFIKKIEDDLFSEYNFNTIVNEYRIYYLEQKKQAVVDNLKETLDLLFNYTIEKDKFLASFIYDAKKCCEPKLTFNPIITRSPIADLYLNDVESYPFNLILAITMECKNKANIIVHSIPYEVSMHLVNYERKGEPTTIAHLAKISQQELKDFFEEKKLHTEEYALRFYHIVQYIHEYLDGDVSQLWINATTKNEIINNLLTLPYMYIDKAEKIFVLLNYNFKIININENNMNTPTQQFLLQSYFGNIQDKTNAAIKRAYRDMNRTLRGIAKEENAKEIKTEWLEIIVDFVKEVQIKNFNSQSEFDDLHKKYCYSLEAQNNKFMSIGQAQKWLNMTLKYLIVLEDNAIIKNKKYFHIPIDNIIQDIIKDKYKIKRLQSAWSQIKDYPLYLKYQDEFRNKLQNTCPINKEMVLFNDALAKEENNLLVNWKDKVNVWLEED